MNWIEAFVLYDDDSYGIECINLSLVRTFLATEDENHTEVIFTDGESMVIKGHYKETRYRVEALKDGESATGAFDYEID